MEKKRGKKGEKKGKKRLDVNLVRGRSTSKTITLKGIVYIHATRLSQIISNFFPQYVPKLFTLMYTGPSGKMEKFEITLTKI
jgi:hypothetical protein